MTWSEALWFFKRADSWSARLTTPLGYVHMVNQLAVRMGRPAVFDEARIYRVAHYGGKRMWIRCLAQKTVQTT
jgi:hypothetical protein